ncbi:MAG: hypothetical protein M5U05_18500 [Anaerolineales bacterium]|nr:hypothetical protein [Anaerolineales bacterium]
MSEQVTSFKAWWADGGRIGGGWLRGSQKPAHLFPYTTAERRPGIRWWAIALFVLAVAGMVWYVNTLLGVLGGAGRQAREHAAGGLIPGLGEAIQTNPTPAAGILWGGEPLAVADLGSVAERVNVRRRSELERAEEVVVVNDQIGEPTAISSAAEVAADLPDPLSEPQIVIVRLRSYWPDDGPDYRFLALLNYVSLRWGGCASRGGMRTTRPTGRWPRCGCCCATWSMTGRCTTTGWPSGSMCSTRTSRRTICVS